MYKRSVLWLLKYAKLVGWKGTPLPMPHLTRHRPMHFRRWPCVHPGRQLMGVILFSWKNLTTFFSHRLLNLMTTPIPHVIYTVLFLNSTTKIILGRVSPPRRVSPGAVRPPPRSSPMSPLSTPMPMHAWQPTTQWNRGQHLRGDIGSRIEDQTDSSSTCFWHLVDGIESVHTSSCSEWVSEQFLNGTSARVRLF